MPGKVGEDGSTQRIEIGEAEVREGSVQYSEVLEGYNSAAQQSMDRDGTPADVRDVVEKYFSSLN